MMEITPENAADYLRASGRVREDRALSVHALGGGVSNVVLRVEIEGERPIVLKQSRTRLRTAALWESRLDRIWTETEALRLLGDVLPKETVPTVLFQDEANFLFAMTCAAPDSIVWKEWLLGVNPDADLGRTIAREAGRVLGTIHAATVGHPSLVGRLADTEVFDQLRIDPFYRTIARVHPDVRPVIDRLIASLGSGDDVTFVHADFSPKNILIHSGGVGLTVVDFETAHAGDPAFDLGFFLSHLLLKGFRPGAWPASSEMIAAFLSAYLPASAPRSSPVAAPTLVARMRRALLHAAACALARIDGKSTVDYLDPPRGDVVRLMAREARGGPPADVGDLLERAARHMRANSFV